MKRLLALLFLLVAFPALALNAPSGLLSVPGATIGFDNGEYVLTVTLQWVNNDDTAVYEVVQYSEDGGTTFVTDVNGIHNHPTVQHVSKIPQGTNRIYRVVASTGVINSSPSDPITLWGEERPASASITTVNTNETRFQFKNQSGTDSDGFISERSTASDFSTSLVVTSVRAGTNGEVMVVTNTGFLIDTTYYYRAKATNSLGFETEWTPTLTARPAAAPGIPAIFQPFISDLDIKVQYSHGDGVADLWYLQVSVGDTNSFTTFHTTSDPASTITDSSEVAGTLCYYRIIGSNAVGRVFSDIKLVVAPSSTAGTIWYVDKNATGNGLGTNWANAFPNFASISWGNILPGALIWIAPGTYNEFLIVGAGGSSSNAITFKVATTNAPAARGQVIMQAIVNNTGGNHYINFDGPLDDNFSLLGKDVRSITNNVGWKLSGNTNIPRAFHTYCEGIRIKWFEVTGPYYNAGEFGEGSVAALYYTGGVGTNAEAGYCWIHDMTADPRNGAEGFWWAPDSGGNAFGGLNIHHCFVERIRDNFMSGGGSIDIHDNYMGPWSGGTPNAAHPDGLQPGAGYWRIYNNIIRDTPGSCTYPEVVQSNTFGLYIYNNLYIGTGIITNTPAASDPWYPRATVYPGSGIQFSTEPCPQLNCFFPTMVITNILIANNTFIGFDSGYLTVTRRSVQCGSIDLRNWNILNNLAFTHNGGAQFGAGYSSDESTPTTGTNFGPSDVILDYNSICGSNNIIGYGATNYTPSSISALGFLHNTTNQAQFANISGFVDLHITNPTNLVGSNLAAAFPNLPGLDRNRDGTLRSVTGWPIGAESANQGDGLILWLSPDIYTGSNTLADASLGGHDMFVSYGTTGSTTNMPILTNGPAGHSAMLSITYRYGVITNWAGLENMTNGSIAVWGRYFSTAGGDSVMFDCGNYPGVTNTWWFGRDDSFFNTRFWIHDADGNKVTAISYPDNSQGVDTGWHHYAATWAGNVFVGYYDGVPFVTNTISSAPYRTVTSDSHWIGVLCYTHNGTPSIMDNESASPDSGFHSYPNNGFMQGGIADLRIYNQVQSAANVLAIFSGQGTSGGGGGGGGGGGTPTTNGTVSGRTHLNGKGHIKTQ